MAAAGHILRRSKSRGRSRSRSKAADKSVRSTRAELRIAIDTGGTFTDCVWAEGGELKTLKVFSTPDDPSRAIGGALRKIKIKIVEGTGDGAARPSLLTLLHGTTVGTNALLQRKGARVALITTSG